MTTREKEEKLVEALKQWQHIENRTIAETAQVRDRTENPLIRMVMEIIQRDSAMHHRVQQFIIDGLVNRSVEVTPDDLTAVWDAIEAHIEAERKTNDFALTARDALKDTKNVIAQYLLAYLEKDERKHEELLEDLALIKRGMYKSA